MSQQKKKGKKHQVSKDETEKKLEELDAKLRKQKKAIEQFLKQIEKENKNHN